jgi:hypothetical protein
LVVSASQTADTAPSTSPKTSACPVGTWPLASGRRAVRFITASMSASTTQFSACALAAAPAPPSRVAQISQYDGMPRAARNIAGTVTTSNCSMIRVLVRPM